MLVKNAFYQFVRILKFLRYTGMFRQSVLSNWSCYLCDEYSDIYYKLGMIFWTYDKRKQFNEQLKKKWL